MTVRVPVSNIVDEFVSHRTPPVIARHWDDRFLKIAYLVSTWSKDPLTKVGAIAVGPDRRILAQGYNGFPSGSKDLPEDYAVRERKYENIVHAESNIIYNACNAKVGLYSATVYVFGMYPCSECIKALAQVGIARVVFQLGDSQSKEKWKEEFKISRRIMVELGIGMTQYKGES